MLPTRLQALFNAVQRTSESSRSRFQIDLLRELEILDGRLGEQDIEDLFEQNVAMYEMEELTLGPGEQGAPYTLAIGPGEYMVAVRPNAPGALAVGPGEQGAPYTLAIGPGEYMVAVRPNAPGALAVGPDAPYMLSIGPETELRPCKICGALVR